MVPDAKDKIPWPISMKKSNRSTLNLIPEFIMYPIIKRMIKGRPVSVSPKTNKRSIDMNPPTAPKLPKVSTSYRVRADVDLTVKALYEMSREALWESLYDWVDSTPGQASARPVLTLLLMWAAREAEAVGATAWRSSVSFVMGFNDSVNPIPSAQQFTWNPVVGTGRSRVSVTVKFLVKPSNRPGVSAYDLWTSMASSPEATRFAEEAGITVSPYSEVTYTNFI